MPSPGSGARPTRPEVLVFGGTTEGRALAEWASARGTCDLYISSLTEYGGSLVQGLANVHSLTGRMLPDRMRRLMSEHRFACVVDATHPYAQGVSASIAQAAAESALPVVRVLREGEPQGPWTSVPDVPAAAHLVGALDCNVLLTTGSNDLATFVGAMPDFRDRLYARILPVEKSLAAAHALDIPTSHVIAMQGPFSRQLNEALVREFNIGALVTKASGKAGGFWEKVEAAQACDVQLVVISRPVEEHGVSLDRAKVLLESEYGL